MDNDTTRDNGSQPQYYAMIDGERKGPFDLDKLADAGIRPSTYVWCKGMPDWQPADEVSDICRYYRGRILDLMHPGTAQRAKHDIDLSKKNDNKQPEEEKSGRQQLMEAYQQFPSIDELESRRDINQKPYNMIPLALAAMVFFFLPTGIAAVYFAVKGRQFWKNGDKQEAHDYTQSAKMWTGITFFLGLIFYAFAFFKL